MERKLVRQGRDALTVTLPSKWIKDRNLKAGGSVYIDISGKALTVSADSSSSSTEITIDARGDNYSMMWHKIISKYVDGFDKITVLHDDPETARSLSSSMIGMIVEEHTKSRTIMKSIVSTPENNIELIIRRVVHMFEQQAILLEELSKGKSTFEDVKAQERLLDANIYYCLRYINKYHLQIDSYKHFLLCATIESAADVVSLLAKYIGSDVKLAKAVREGVVSYNRNFFTGDLQKTYLALRSFRRSVGTKTFAQGLAFELAELLYNNIGYLMDRN